MLVSWSVAIIVALALCYFFDLSFWPCLGIVILAGILNGFFAEWEDRRDSARTFKEQKK